MINPELSKAHVKVREILAHHGIKDVHTALVADLIYAIEDIVLSTSNDEKVYIYE